jgi:hypothetical protein
VSKITLTTKHGRTRYRVEIEVNLRPLQRVAPELTIDLEPAAADARELSICALIYRNDRDDCETAGQCRETVLSVLAHHPAIADVTRLCALWERWHLNGMQAGTRAQREALEDMAPAVYPQSHYDKACAHLETKGLLFDRGYRYGNAWLSEPLPSDVVQEVESIVARLQDCA